MTLHLWRGAYQIHQVKIEKTDGKVPVPFFSAPLVDLSVEWKALFNGAFVGEIDFHRPHMNFVNGPSEASSQVGIDKPGGRSALFDSGSSLCGANGEIITAISQETEVDVEGPSPMVATNMPPQKLSKSLIAESRWKDGIAEGEARGARARPYAAKPTFEPTRSRRSFAREEEDFARLSRTP